MLALVQVQFGNFPPGVTCGLLLHSPEAGQTEASQQAITGSTGKKKKLKCTDNLKDLFH